MSKLFRAMSMLCVFGFATAALAAAPSFDEIDVNRDGVVSKGEAAQVKGLDFAKADTNRDGKLSRAEYEAAIG